MQIEHEAEHEGDCKNNKDEDEVAQDPDALLASPLGSVGLVDIETSAISPYRHAFAADFCQAFIIRFIRSLLPDSNKH